MENPALTTESRKKLVERIAKLLALSENNPEGNEAASAKKKALDLMVKHEIDMQTVTLGDEPEYKEVKTYTNRKKHVRHDVLLENAVSSFNNVAYVILKNGVRAGKVFIGRPEDIEINDYMLEILYAQRSVAWKKYLAEYKALHGERPKSSEKHKWMKGFGYGVAHKLQELRNESEAEVAQGCTERGLVPVDRRKQAYDAYSGASKLTKAKSKVLKFSSAGFQAGKKVEINKAVE